MEDTNDSEALLWDMSRRKRDIDDYDKVSNDRNTKKLCIENKIDSEGSCSTTSHVIVSNKEKVSKETNDDVKTKASLKPIDGTQALRTDEESFKSKESPEKVQTAEITKEELQEFVNNEKNFMNEEIHEKLKAIDPVMASRLHPNNRRKVLR